MSCTTGCLHINKLAPLPLDDELRALRKGKRKRKLPEISDGFVGDHTVLGHFSMTRVDGEVLCEWQLPDQEIRKATFTDLNVDIALEGERLELGWMIANMYQLDGLHFCESIPDPNEAMRAMAYYNKHIEAWRHWALVPAGHMLLKKEQ